jgi:hypothetical protein
MSPDAPQLLISLEASGLGSAIRQSSWIYPAANVGHVVSVVLFFAALAVMVLTLLGVIDARRRNALVIGARRATSVFLGLALLTGAVLFIAEASHVALNRVFQLKLLLIGLAVVNVLVVGGRAVAAAVETPEGVRLPGWARASAMASLVIWISVAALGRFIAYV